VSWRLVFTKLAKKDAKKIVQSGLKPQANRLLDLLRKDLIAIRRPMKNSSAISPALIPEESTYSIA